MIPLSRRTLLGALAVAGLPAMARSRDTDPQAVAQALAGAADPLAGTEPHGRLDDLRPLGAAVGNVPVVGLGEVVHGSHELYTLKHRVFRYLVMEKGFTAFALEASWSAGLRLDAHVRRGTGDLRRIMDEEFGRGAWPWQVREYLSLISWMRRHNARHPHHQVRFLGADLSYPRLGDALFRGVGDYVGRWHPHLLGEFERYYRELRAHAAAADFAALPQAERDRIAGLAGQAAERFRDLAVPADRAGHAWAAQHAWNIAETAALLALDLDDADLHRQAMRRRDALMSHNVAWWYRQVGGRVLVSAHNGHTAYVTYDPAHYPTSQGGLLRQTLGGDYLSVGTTFGRGERIDTNASGQWETTAFGPPQPGSSEETLVRAARLAGHRDMLLDLRTVPAVARAWLDRPRSTRDIGHPDDPYREYVLGAGHDVLVHLDRLRAARPLR